MPQKPAKHGEHADEGQKTAGSKVKVSSKNSFRVLTNSIKALTKSKKIESATTPTHPRPSTPTAGGHHHHHIDNAKDLKRRASIFRRPSWRKFTHQISKFAQQVNLGPNLGQTKHDRVPPINWPPNVTPGAVGLRNHGNTCFMNAVLQCLSHTDLLAEYFVLDQYKADLKRRNKLNSKKFGTKGELTEQLALVLKSLWTCQDVSDHSSAFKAVVDRYGAQFRSSTQHDAQEFLFWMLDKVHEDLNTASKRKYKSVKNTYGRPDEVIAAETLANHIRCNNSFVQAVFQAQFRSSLTCPRCEKQSNTFDPFHCISVQLPQLTQQSLFIKVIYGTQQPKQVQLGLGIPHGSSVILLRDKLVQETRIPADQIILTEIGETGFNRILCDSHPLSSVSEIDPIYCIETPKLSENTPHILLLIANAKRGGGDDDDISRFGTPFCLQVSRDISFSDLQKMLLKEMKSVLKPEVFAYTTPLNEMFKIHLIDPSADPDTYIEPTVEHPLFTEMIDMALSVFPADAGPAHVKFLLEWAAPDKYFSDLVDPCVEHESVGRLRERPVDVTSLTLEDCLDHYTKAETLSTEDAWRCPHCQKYLPVVKTLGLWSLPDILVIHFKRFRQQQTRGSSAAKLTTMVEFPLTNFDMSKHLARSKTEAGADDSPWRKNKRQNGGGGSYLDNKYDLYSVCYHQGDTLETGHYTAACKNPYDHQWYRFDDQKVTQVPNVQEEIVNNEAYILFYQRRKADGSECSGASSSSSEHWVSRIAPDPAVAGLSTRSSTLKSTVSMPEPEHPNVEIETKAEADKPQVVVEPLAEKEEEKPEPQVIPVEELPPEDDDGAFKTPLNELQDEAAEVDVVPEPAITYREKNTKEQAPFTKFSWNADRPSSGTKIHEIISQQHSSMPNSFLSRMDYEAVRMIRGASSCSKDTLLFIDQQSNGYLDESDDDMIESNRRSLWISPVTPHKLVTVSPKN